LFHTAAESDIGWILMNPCRTLLHVNNLWMLSI